MSPLEQFDVVARELAMMPEEQEDAEAHLAKRAELKRLLHQMELPDRNQVVTKYGPDILAVQQQPPPAGASMRHAWRPLVDRP